MEHLAHPPSSRASRARKRWLIPLAVVTVMSVVVAGPAAAHYIYDKRTTFGSDTNCTGGRGEVSHGPGGGYAKADTYSWYAQWTPYGNLDCGRDWARPEGYIISAYHYYKWYPEYNNWYVCTYTDWISNNVPTHQWYVWGSWTSPPCGTGYYATQAHGQVWNNAWFGGAVWSGYHLF